MADITCTTTSLDSSKLPQLSLNLVLSMDLASASDRRTTASETTTISERHDSARTSICSSDTDSSNTLSSKKARKRVRFEESVCCSYFDANSCTPPPEPEAVPQPELRRRPSLMSRSWARITMRNSSNDSVGSSSPASLERLKSGNYSVDLLDAGGRRSSFAPGRSHSVAYSIHQPLRESAGRRYNRAQTTVCWKATAPTAKGDWDDLLGTTTPQRPPMNRSITC